jgi:hypothetical protein
MARLEITVILLSLLLLIYVFELVRRRHLNEEYSIGWLAAGLVIFILSIWRNILDWITRVIGGTYYTSTLFFFGILFLIMINLHFSVKISGLSNMVRRLSQELALLKSEIEEYRRDS